MVGGEDLGNYSIWKLICCSRAAAAAGAEKGGDECDWELSVLVLPP